VLAMHTRLTRRVNNIYFEIYTESAHFG